MAVPRDGAVRVRPGRAVTLAASLSLTLSAGVVSALGLVTAPHAAAHEPDASHWLTEPLHAVVDEAMPAALDDGRYVDFDQSGHSAVDHAGEQDAEQDAEQDGGTVLDPVPPPHSGTGRRVVFDQSAQQVWLVRDGDSVPVTYLVSGSVHDNLDPGTYEVFSRSRHAVGFDYSSTMDYMVRFAEGANAAIGFHDIPVDGQGQPVQRWAELGTPMSSGCIRQRPRDAREMWRFAEIGTLVVVVA